MRKGSMFSIKFWDSDLRAALLECRPACIWVAFHLIHGPTAEVSSIYRVSIGQIAEDTGLSQDEVRACIAELCAADWCEYHHPVIWIRGHGNINDKLGTRDFRQNDSWVRATQKHLDAMPDSPLVERFRAYHWPSPLPGGEGGGDPGGEGATGEVNNSLSVSPSPLPSSSSTPTAPSGPGGPNKPAAEPTESPADKLVADILAGKPVQHRRVLQR